MFNSKKIKELEERVKELEEGLMFIIPKVAHLEAVDMMKEFEKINKKSVKKVKTSTKKAKKPECKCEKKEVKRGRPRKEDK